MVKIQQVFRPVTLFATKSDLFPNYLCYNYYQTSSFQIDNTNNRNNLFCLVICHITLISDVTVLRSKLASKCVM